MKRLPLLMLLIFAGLYLNAEIDDCTELREDWKSEKEAIERIENTIFATNESISGRPKSWLVSAHYYTCDDQFGYLIVKSAKKVFFHQDVPIETWNALKNAKSIGGYYNFYIKNRYKLDNSNRGSRTI